MKRKVLIPLFEMAEKEFIPLVSMIELTHRCNQRCTHCYIEEYGNIKRKELTTREIKILVNEISELGGLYLTLTGGEVFLRKDIFEIIGHIRKKGFALTIFTNGTFISEDTAKKLKNYGVLEVGISLYASNPKLHDKIANLSGSFKNTLKGIKLLVKYGVPVCIKSPLMKTNVKEYKKIMKLAKELGCRTSFDTTIVPKNDGTGLFKELRLNEKNLATVFSDRKLYPQKTANQRGTPLFCGAGRNVCTITPYGDVFPCIQLLVKAGNIRKKSFKNIWRHSLLLKKIRNITDDKLKGCYVCNKSAFCSRCAGLALLEDKDLYGPSKTACKIAKIRANISRF